MTQPPDPPVPPVQPVQSGSPRRAPQSAVAAHPVTSAVIAILVIASIFFSLYVPLYASATPPVSRGTRGALTVVLVTFAVSIAWSRVYLGVHFPGDVTGGDSSRVGGLASSNGGTIAQSWAGGNVSGGANSAG